MDPLPEDVPTTVETPPEPDAGAGDAAAGSPPAVDGDGAASEPNGEAVEEAATTGEDPASPSDGVDGDAPPTTAEADPGAAPTADAGVLVESSPAPADMDVASWLPIGLAGLMLLILVTVLLTRRSSSGVADAMDESVVESTGASKPGRSEERLGLAERLKVQMSATRDALRGQFDSLFGRERLSLEDLEALEEVLLMADVGMPTTTALLAGLRTRLRGQEADGEELRGVLREEMSTMLKRVDVPLVDPSSPGLTVVMVVGVNGSGKTTTIGKLATRWQREGLRVLLAAGDTYRAAAAAQLKVWGERAGVDVVAHDEGGDPGAVVYDALEAAKARDTDVLIIDTSGRLQTKRPLMEQLTKLRRIIDKKVPGAPHETLLVVDGTMGQNAMSQARSFHEATPLTGVAVTKLDGTAKGGMVLAIAQELQLPIKLIGIGEKMDDLQDFEAEAFLEALT